MRNPIQSIFLASAFSLISSACVTTPPPVLEYNLARAAIEAAQAVEASRFDAGNMHDAEEAYRKAEALFDEREHEVARTLFRKARAAAEKAENTARAMKQRAGEVF
jgi:hypothetical protein